MPSQKKTEALGVALIEEASGQTQRMPHLQRGSISCRGGKLESAEETYCRLIAPPDTLASESSDPLDA